MDDQEGRDDPFDGLRMSESGLGRMFIRPGARRRFASGGGDADGYDVQAVVLLVAD